MVKLTQAHLVMGLFVVKMKDGNHVGATVLTLPPPDPSTPNCYNNVMTEASFEVMSWPLVKHDEAHLEMSLFVVKVFILGMRVDCWEKNYFDYFEGGRDGSWCLVKVKENGHSQIRWTGPTRDSRRDKEKEVRDVEIREGDSKKGGEKRKRGENEKKRWDNELEETSPLPSLPTRT